MDKPKMYRNGSYRIRVSMSTGGHYAISSNCRQVDEWLKEWTKDRFLGSRYHRNVEDAIADLEAFAEFHQLEEDKRS